jgi:hypothetical protein
MPLAQQMRRTTVIVDRRAFPKDAFLGLREKLAVRAQGRQLPCLVHHHPQQAIRTGNVLHETSGFRIRAGPAARQLHSVEKRTALQFVPDQRQFRIRDCNPELNFVGAEIAAIFPHQPDVMA